ncbi:hypothetical protein DAEQUDRAFT_764185 [Daedalea quercina L-15889]|uniref:Transmembrane protein n=1 Tax=Daedalea quercina L-15889 TaxID=1314783 RepID=A0A165RM81_9APHY|nr:hypothetical protein DAEQUDRAFT_764185 [Daedalea quercina L-15889]
MPVPALAALGYFGYVFGAMMLASILRDRSIYIGVGNRVRLYLGSAEGQQRLLDSVLRLEPADPGGDGPPPPVDSSSQGLFLAPGPEFTLPATASGPMLTEANGSASRLAFVLLITFLVIIGSFAVSRLWRTIARRRSMTADGIEEKTNARGPPRTAGTGAHAGSSLTAPWASPSSRDLLAAFLFPEDTLRASDSDSSSPRPSGGLHEHDFWALMDDQPRAGPSHSRSDEETSARSSNPGLGLSVESGSDDGDADSVVPDTTDNEAGSSIATESEHDPSHVDDSTDVVWETDSVRPDSHSTISGSPNSDAGSWVTTNAEPGTFHLDVDSASLAGDVDDGLSDADLGSSVNADSDSEAWVTTDDESASNADDFVSDSGVVEPPVLDTLVSELKTPDHSQAPQSPQISPADELLLRIPTFDESASRFEYNRLRVRAVVQSGRSLGSRTSTRSEFTDSGSGSSVTTDADSGSGSLATMDSDSGFWADMRVRSTLPPFARNSLLPLRDASSQAPGSSASSVLQVQVRSSLRAQAGESIAVDDDRSLFLCALLDMDAQDAEAVARVGIRRPNLFNDCLTFYQNQFKTDRQGEDRDAQHGPASALDSVDRDQSMFLRALLAMDREDALAVYDSARKRYKLLGDLQLFEAYM